ncbi:MAG TPA: hypothetical protein VFP60_18760 [Pseudolabrys sp.]|nr:hypothetical protein [Pseudolabrys sp.]
MLDKDLLRRLLCVALVAALMMPLGRALFPYVSEELTRLQFQALEAVASAALGLGLSAFFG